ncbi:MAG TPA: cytochrome P450, partial [Phenylobacterium sp.]
LAQTFEATAALIAGTLLALGRHPQALASVQADPRLIGEALAETIRWDPSVQNMRRFVGEDAQVAGLPMRAGDRVILVTAAASRDPAVNPDPESFRLERPSRRLFGFGDGAHACPADRLARQIAGVAVGRLLQGGLDARRLPAMVAWRRSVFRIPLFA